jgi:CMP-2-keto-3-deoxyoctulosonic acid synthetase
MVETTHVGIGIDTPEDLEKARKMLQIINFGFTLFFQ